MATMLKMSYPDEGKLIRELNVWEPHMRVYPQAVEYGCRWYDMVTVAALLSRMMWWPKHALARHDLSQGVQCFEPNRLMCAEHEIHPNGGVFVKYTVGGRSGEHIQNMARAFHHVQIRPVPEDYRKALDKLVGIYLEGKEKSRSHMRDLQAMKTNATQANVQGVY